jgi:hypothetical protein
MGKLRVNLVAQDASEKVLNIFNEHGIEELPLDPITDIVVVILPKFDFEGNIYSACIPPEYQDKVILAYKKRGSGEIGFYKTKVTFYSEGAICSGYPYAYVKGIPNSSQDAEEMLFGNNKFSTYLKNNQDKVIPTKSVLVSPNNNLLLLM